MAQPIRTTGFTDMLDRVFPDYFFKTNPSVLHRKAPLNVALRVLALQFVVVLVALALFLWYFSELTDKETVVSNAVKDGYRCSVLSPLTGTTYGYGLGSLNSSQNGQFTGSTMNYDECVQYLTSHHVCNYTYDYISVVGVGNNYGSRLFTSGSLLEVSDFNQITQTQTGQSSSFTRPSVPAANYTNYKQNIFYYLRNSYVYNGKSILDIQNVAYYVLDGTHDYAWTIVGDNDGYLLKVYPYRDKPSVSYSNYDYSPLAVDSVQLTSSSNTYYAYQMAVNDGHLFGFNKTSVSNNIDNKHGNGHLLRVNIHHGTSIEWTTPISYCGNASLVVSKFMYYHRNDRYYGSCDEYRASSDSYYTVAVFWIDPNVLYSITAVALSTPIQTVNNRNFFFPTNTSLYVDNLHRIDLLTGEVSSVPQPSSDISLGSSYRSTWDANIIYFETSDGNVYVFNTTTGLYNMVEYYYSLYYMLSYSYALCNGRVEKVFVNVSTDMSYDVLCTEQDGFYYQAPNQWFDTPMHCATMQPPELLSKCPEVVSGMSQLKDNTCSNSIVQMCHAAYTLNPPFSCERDRHLTLLEILASSFADTQAVKIVVSIVCALALAIWYRSYEPFAPSEDLVAEMDKLRGENRRLQNTLDAVVAYLRKDGGFKYDDSGGGGGGRGGNCEAHQPIIMVVQTSTSVDEERAATPSVSTSVSSSRHQASSRDTSSRMGSTAFYVYNPAHALWSDHPAMSEVDDVQI